MVLGPTTHSHPTIVPRVVSTLGIYNTGSGFYKIGDLHSLEYIPGYGWFVINVNGDGFGDVSPTSSTSGT